METLLIRQISYQVTDKIKAAFPDASWEYIRPVKAESLLNCDIIRIRTFHTGDYNFADVSLDRYGHLKLFMMTITDFTPLPGQKNPSHPKMSDGELRETQAANYFSNLYPIDCAVLSVNAQSCRKYGTLPEHEFLPGI